MPNGTGPDAPVPCGKVFGSPRRDEPRAEAHVGALIGGVTTTRDSSNCDAPAVEQQDVTPWVPVPYIVGALIVAIGFDVALCVGLWCALRGLAC
jgi:hypothetical protein